MAAPPFIAARVTPETKSLLRVLAEREQKTESAVVRELLEVVLRTATVGELPRLDEKPRPNRDIRLSVRLDPNDRLLLTERAAARGVPPATYVAALVRSHLRGIAPLLKEEFLALNRGQSAAPRRDDLQAMLRVCGALRDHVKALLAANDKSWDQGHAETAH